jgi:hypothetical protein
MKIHLSETEFLKAELKRLQDDMQALAAQPAPVQDIEHCIWARNGNTPCPHTTPPAAQRQWVGLSDEDKEFIELTGGKSDVLLAELVEAKLKEKNT